MSKELKLKILSICIKLFVVVGACIGIIVSATKKNFMSSNVLLFFTNQSNIWIASICLVFVIFEIISLKKNVNIPNWLYIIKYMFTVAITLTFLVFSVLLTPQMIKMGQGSYLFSVSNIFVHNLVPIFAILDFCLFDYKAKTNKTTFLYGLIMPLYYYVFANIVSLCGVTFGGGQKFPYYFMDYHKNGWFSIANGNLGCFYWLVILIGAVVGIALLLIFAKNKIAKTKNKFANTSID